MAVILGCAMQASLNQGSMLQEYDPDHEVFRQCFRQFQYKEAAGPRDAFSKLRELCFQWLQPHMHSKEQILELLVLEQFLNILPTKIETWVRLYSPENRERILSLIEDLEEELEISKNQAHKKETLSEEQQPVETAHTPPHIELESSAIQVVGPSQHITLAEEWIPQDEPQELNYSTAGECQPFLEFGKSKV
ncbi:zinc finger protein 449-like [Tamandua tetradactyla]|uniref:zinc finger protein 449-like n=1 Tax=Tamandua tetradactyla TaxID=48850 RepID=UPI004053AFD7